MILQPCGCRHLFRLDRKVVLPPAARWQNFGQGLIDLVEAWAWGRGQTCRLILNAWQPPQKGLIGTYFGTQKFDKNEWLTVTKSHYRLFLDS
jgi:GNAT superfamily N-acetyltransferase